MIVFTLYFQDCNILRKDVNLFKNNWREHLLLVLDKYIRASTVVCVKRD